MLKKYGLYLLFTVVIFAGQFLRSSNLVTGTPPAISQTTLQNQPALALISQGPAVIYFWAEWCGPCRAIGPVIEELAVQYEGKVNIGKVNVDVNPNLSMNFGITSIPAILFVKGGQVVDKQIGAVPKAVLDKKIQSHM